MSWRYSSWTDNGLFGIQRQSLTLAVYLFNAALNDIWRGKIHFLNIGTRLHKNTFPPTPQQATLFLSWWSSWVDGQAVGAGGQLVYS